MTRHIRPTTGFLIAVLASSGGSALAQTGSNEVWIGQTGSTNSIVILQEGESNRAGADNVFLRLNQDGDRNSLTIDQYGWNNSVGSIFLEPSRPSGTNQIGDRNEIDILQRNSEPSGVGFNIVGTVIQFSDFLLSDTANALLVRQTENGGADLAAGHRVNSVSQRNTIANSTANTVEIWQSGGGAGLGNVVDQVFQEGVGNAAQVYQAGQENGIGLIQQMGAANVTELEQGNGEQNLMEIVQQFGNLNRAAIRQSGSRNVVQQALQNNEILAGGGVGNRMEVVISGEDNGGDGLGGVGDFAAQATRDRGGVSQGDLLQLGDDNDISLTIIQGELSKFGIVQIGDGNGAIVVMGAEGGGTSSGNETAIFQDGLDNDIAHTAIGDLNVASARQSGEGNFADLVQAGDRNLIVIDMVGDENNASSLGGFASELDAIAGAGSLQPGRLSQTGLLNGAVVDVAGSRNLFGVSQSGESHVADIRMMGTSNQIAVVQTGASNTSLSLQTGAGNALAVRQF